MDPEKDKTTRRMTAQEMSAESMARREETTRERLVTELVETRQIAWALLNAAKKYVGATVTRPSTAEERQAVLDVLLEAEGFLVAGLVLIVPSYLLFAN